MRGGVWGGGRGLAAGGTLRAVERAAPKLVRLAHGLARADWSGALEGFNPNHAQTLKMAVGAGVYRSTMLGRPVVVKIRLACGPVERLKLLTRTGRAWRQWRGAEVLARAGVPAAGPLAIAVEPTAAGPREWLVLEALPGRTLLAHAADVHAGRGVLTPRAQHALASAAGALAGAIDRAGLFNRDLKPSNVIVTSLGTGGGGPVLAVVDTVAVRRGRGLARMLHALAVEPLGVGALPRRGLLMRALHAAEPDKARRHALWREVARSLEAHGDPTPVDDPLEGERGSP